MLLGGTPETTWEEDEPIVADLNVFHEENIELAVFC